MVFCRDGDGGTYLLLVRYVYLLVMGSIGVDGDLILRLRKTVVSLARVNEVLSHGEEHDARKLVEVLRHCFRWRVEQFVRRNRFTPVLMIYAADLTPTGLARRL